MLLNGKDIADPYVATCGKTMTGCGSMSDTQVFTELGHLLYKERLQHLGLLGLEKRCFGRHD